MTFPSGITVTCCGYQNHQGVPAPWTCPACGKIHAAHIPAPDPPVTGPAAGTLPSAPTP